MVQSTSNRPQTKIGAYFGPCITSRTLDLSAGCKLMEQEDPLCDLLFRLLANPCATAPLFKMTGPKARSFFCNWRISVGCLKSKHGNARFSQSPELFYAGLPRRTTHVAKYTTMRRCAHLWFSYPEPVRQRLVSRVQHADAPLAFGNFRYACNLTIPTGLTMVIAVMLMSYM